MAVSFVTNVGTSHDLLTRSTDVVVASAAPSEKWIPFQRFVDNFSAPDAITLETARRSKNQGRLNVPKCAKMFLLAAG